MMKKNTLNLLVIDEEQLYAEHLVDLLSTYFDEVHLGFWDEKSEFIKALRQEWDVLVFHRAYDMTLADVVGILQEEQVRLPVISLIETTAGIAMEPDAFPESICGDMIKSIKIGEDKLIVSAICLQADYIRAKRQTASLQAVLKEAEQRANILIKNSKSAVAYIDQGVHVFANDPYLEMFGYKAIEDIIGVPVVDLISGGDNVKGFKQFLRKFDKGDRSQVEFAFESKRTNGSTFASKLQLAVATFEGEPVVQMIIQQNESGNSAELAKKLAEAERQDILTGLTNRLAFMEMLNHAYTKINADELSKAALLYIRMDGVGKIHSSTGLLGVDTAVKQVAWLLDECVQKHHQTSVSRFSDYAFAAVIDDVDENKVSALAQELVKSVVGLLIEVDNRTITAGISVGIVMIDSNSPEPSVLISRAMDTVSQIDADGDDKVQVFDISSIASENDDAMSEYIQNALMHNKFILRYQPIYDINADCSNLFEVFVSLPQADGTELSFEKLAPIAKKANLLDKIDRWVLINASKHLATIRQTEPSAALLIGLSALALSDTNLANVVVQLTRAVGGHAGALTLQFNEQDLVDYMAVAKRQFVALANIDCKISMSSFGLTAKSSEVLNYLAPQIVRLSASYTKDLDKETNLSTLQNLINSASQKNADVMMPYIEDASTMSTAWSVGVRYLQGNYLQPAAEQIVFPLPAEH